MQCQKRKRDGKRCQARAVTGATQGSRPTKVYSVVEGADIVIALGKVWKRRNRR